MELLQPRTLTEALQAMANGRPVTPIAGGTDLMVNWHHAAKDDLLLMDLLPITELRRLQLSDGWLELGALTTYWDVIQSKPLGQEFPLLVKAALQVGAIQIQTRGTWAGNIGNASPAADGVPVLMAYDATVLLQSLGGLREVPLDNYYTGYKQTVRRPDELIVGIKLPRRPRRLQWFHKVGARSAQTIAKLGVGIVYDEPGWRVVANSVAPYVCRCANLERALNDGRTFATPGEILDTLQRDISPITDLRSTAQYRAHTLARLIYWRLTQEQGRSSRLI